MNLRILGRIGIDNIITIKHNNFKNKSLKMTKDNQPTKGGDDLWKGGPARRLHKGK